MASSLSISLPTARNLENRLTRQQGISFAVPKNAGIIALAALNVILLGAYVFQVNSNTSQGYEIKKIQARVGSLTEENRKLSLKTAEAGSMAKMESEVEKSGFVAAGTPVFLETRSFTLK